MPTESPHWKDEAKRDLADIIAYIAADNPAAADALLDRIETRAALLPTQPLAHRAGRIPGTREMVLHPNYILVYSVTDAAVTILRLLHAARDRP